MLEKIWSTLFGKIVMTLLISMIPVIELRGAIPIATANGLNIWVAIVVSIIGNLIPVPFIIVFIKRIFAWIRTKSAWLNKIVTKLESRAEKKSETVKKCAFWGLFIFVAIPLPGTGAWTGALVAAMLNMKVRESFPAIAFGVLCAGVIVACVTLGVGSLLFG